MCPDTHAGLGVKSKSSVSTQLPGWRKRWAIQPCVLLLALFGASAQPAPGGPSDFFRGGPGGGGPGGPGGMMREETKLLGKFDKDANGFLGLDERKAAREYLAKEKAEGRGRRGGMGPRRGGGGESAEPNKAGEKVAVADAKSGGDASLYDAKTLRTFFLEFDSPEWEKELVEFHDTDVEVPAKLTVDGKTYSDVGVHFRGMSSFGMVRDGQKRSLNLSMDFVNKEQKLLGYRTLNLLNSHEDPSFIRGALYARIAQEYIPTPKANFVRVVINGEDWGIYCNSEQFNKEFLKENFGTTKGTRWKAQGSPGGRATFAYLGDKVDDYKKAYSIKTKDNKKAWEDLVTLCKVLNETPAEKLEAALTPLLDIDGALKFLALENALINNDGYWIRTSDYNLYQDDKGRFHILPHDSNETFSRPGGPGFGGGRGGRGGPGGGPGGGRGGFGPGMMLAPSMVESADTNGDKALSPEEFNRLADVWFDKLDTAKAGKLTAEDFAEQFGGLLSLPEGGPRGGGGPGRFVGPGVFAAVDANHDGSLTRDELKGTFGKWAKDWDKEKKGKLTEETLRAGLEEVLPRPNFGGGPGGPGGGGPGGPGGPGGGPGGGGTSIKGVELDPLHAAKDANKPLLSKLLAVPALRAKYLGYERDIADKWLDWNRLGPIAKGYHDLIAEYVKKDTRKLDSFEAFEKSLATRAQEAGGRSIGIKEFADQRRTYLMNYVEKK